MNLPINKKPPKTPNKWAEFFGRNYKLVNLGRPAIFLLPIKKLHKHFRTTTVEKYLHAFLTKNFDAYTTSTVPSFGIWNRHKGHFGF